jgi:hypothetical protein
MPKVQFFGRILPSVCKVTLTLDPSTSITWIDEERNNTYVFKIFIIDGIVRVECDAPHHDQSCFDEVYRRALDLARASVDVLAFGTGFGLTVVFEKFKDATGVESELMIQDPRLGPLVTAFKLNIPPPNNLEETLKIVWTEPALFFAMRDLIEAITLPHRTPVCCGRAVEGLRNLMTGSDMPRGQAWGEFRRNLQLDESYIKMITDHSVAPRHGEHSRVSGEITFDIVQRAWKIMDRFLIYRLRGNKPLLDPEFPLLRG